MREYDTVQREILELETQILNSRQNQAKKSDILTFKFIADGLGLNLDRTVRYFILILIFVFDPMALALVLLYQYYQKSRLNTIETKIVQVEKEKIIYKEPTVRGIGM
jgi:hypothetical protein